MWHQQVTGVEAESCPRTSWLNNLFLNSAHTRTHKFYKALCWGHKSINRSKHRSGEEACVWAGVCECVCISCYPQLSHCDLLQSFITEASFSPAENEMRDETRQAALIPAGTKQRRSSSPVAGRRVRTVRITAVVRPFVRPSVRRLARLGFLELFPHID